MIKTGKFIYIALIILVLFPYNLIPQLPIIITPAVALLIGIVYAIIFKCPYPKFNKKTSKYLLQASVVGLGFGMNVNESLHSGANGMMFTIISVIGVMVMGVLIGYWLHINRKTAYLISSGTIIAKTKCTTFQNEMYIFLIFSHLAKRQFERLLITV